MALMARMRSLAPLFIISVGVIFVLFMVISDSNFMEIFGARGTVIGSVNGRDINYIEYDSTFTNYREQYQAQSGQDVEDENIQQLRDQVWSGLVQQILAEQAYNTYGIEVSEDEIRNLLFGENPPQFLVQQFMDSLGRFNRQAYEQALQAPENRPILAPIIESLRAQEMQSKLIRLINASYMPTEGEIRRSYIDKNIKMNADYVLIDIFSFADSLFKATDDELKEYYNKNLEEFSQEATRTLEYVLFPIAASGMDSNSVKEDLTSIMNQMRDTTSFASLIGTFGESPYSKDTVSINALPKGLVDSVKRAESLRVFGPLPTEKGFAMVNVVAMIDGGDPSVNASHILIGTMPNAKLKGDTVAALNEINRIYEDVNSGKISFEEAAKKFSEDPMSGVQGGNLGWFAKGQMVPEFEKACFEGPVGTVQKPVKTQYGYHIIKVINRDSRKYVIEKLEKTVRPSGETRDLILKRAKEFAFLSRENGFQKAAETAPYLIQETPPFLKEVMAIPGIGYNKQLVDFSFEESVNEISPVYSYPGGYVVSRIKEGVEAGPKKFDEVKENVNYQVIRQKKIKKAVEIANDIKAKVGGNLANANTVFGSARFSTTADFTTGGSIPGVGVDYAFSAAAYKAKLNTVTEPIKGQRGIYLVKVTKRDAFNEQAYKSQRQSLIQTLLQETRSSLAQEWFRVKEANSDITDNRRKFYQY